MMPKPATDEIWTLLCSRLETEGCKEPSRYVELVETAAGGGRGLIAKGAIPPGTVMIAIPPSALLNCDTLRPLYPAHFFTSLTSTQFISLHLALQYARHASGAASLKPSPRDRFWPFIESLPRKDGFNTVPLTWTIDSKPAEVLRSRFDVDIEDDVLDDSNSSVKIPRARCCSLLECLPSSVRTRNEDVERRFKTDWLKAKSIWSASNEDGPLRFRDFVLGWLNVNTRCVYFDVGRKTSDNLTLAPVIDFINHADGRETKPLQSLRRGLTFSSPSTGSKDPPLRDGDELAFSYGAHEDAMLLTEYGFTLHASGGNPFNNVDITKIVEQLFEDLGESERNVKEGLLQDNGYWGEMTLQPEGDEAHPSWRVLVALRLLHLELPTKSTTTVHGGGMSAQLATSLEPWYRVIAGDDDVVSSHNERKVQATLRVICDVVRLQAREGLEKIEAVERDWETATVPDSCWTSLRMLKGIFVDEQRIVEIVRNRPLAPPPPSVYPSLHGTLASDSTPSATIDRPSSDQHQTRSEQSSNAASANNNKRLVSSNAGQQSARAHPGDASLEGISSCSTLPRPRKLPFPAGHDATAGTVSEIQSFSSSSLRHSGGVAMQYLQQDEPLGDALLADSENERDGSHELAMDDIDGTAITADVFNPLLDYVAGTFDQAPDLSHLLPDQSSLDGEPIGSTILEPGTDITTQISTEPRRTGSSSKRSAPSFAVEVSQPVSRKSSTSSSKKVPHRKNSTSRRTVPTSDDELAITGGAKKRSRSSKPIDLDSSQGGHTTDYDEQPHGSKSLGPPVRNVDSRPTIVEDDQSSDVYPPALDMRVSATFHPSSDSVPTVAELAAIADRAVEEEVERSIARQEESDEDFGGGSKRKRKKELKGKKGKEKVKKADKPARKPSRRKSSNKAAESAVVNDEPAQNDVVMASATDAETPAPTADKPSSLQPVPISEIPTSESVLEVNVASTMPKSSKRRVIDSDEDEAEETTVVVTPVITSQPKKKRAKTDRTSEKPKSKGKGKRRTVESDADEEDFDAGEAEEAAAELSDEEAAALRAPANTTHDRKGKGKAADAPKKNAKGRKSVSSRMDAVVQAAQEGVETSLLVSDEKKGTVETGAAVEAAAASDEDGSAKENDALAAKAVDTPALARAGSSKSAVSRNGTPSVSSSFKKPRGLAGLLDKKGFHAHRPPGLSARAKVPRLHMNLKPPPPPKAALPKEKVRKKKGHESYSDEEKPWYERKHPEDWDSDDNRKWNKRMQRINKGLASDSGDEL